MSPKTIKFISLFIILVLTFISFSSAFNNQFTNWDDNKYVTNNPDIKTLNCELVVDLFSRKTIGKHHYHPLTLLTFAVEYHFFKLNPFVYIIDNVLLHILNTAFVFLLIGLLTNNLRFAIITSVLFGIHPMRVESVAWIPERKDVLYAFFYLLSLISYVRYCQDLAEGPRRYLRYILFALLLFVCSLLSKPFAVTLPLSLGAIDYYLQRKLSVRLIAEKIPFLLLSIAFGWIAISQGGAETLKLAQLNDRIMLASYRFFTYTFKAFLPIKLSCYYPWPEKLAGFYPRLFSVAKFSLIFLILLFSVGHKKVRNISFGIIFYCVNIFFVIGVIPISRSFLGDRNTYVAYIGLFFIIACGMDAFMKFLKRYKDSYQKIFILFFCLIVIFFCRATYIRCDVFQNGITLWTDVIRKYPNVFIAYQNRGNAYGEMEKYDLALFK